MIPARPIVPLLLSLGLTSLAATAAGWQVPGRGEPQLKKAARPLPEVVETDIVTREAICRWAVQPPVLDGKLDDKCWEQAVPIEQFASYWDKDKTPRAGTRAYLVWDDEALYYGATMTDSELRAYGTKRNDTLWEGDVFELFFKPSPTRPEYYEFQANPRALVFECAFPKRGDYPKDLTRAPVLGNKAVVTVSGTLDQPGDRDEGWTVEGRIPWSAFTFTGKPKPGDEWRFALCRYDFGPRGTKPILMSSAPLSQPSFHRHEDYGRLRFEGRRHEGRP
jgi:hypothetical protein